MHHKIITKRAWTDSDRPPAIDVTVASSPFFVFRMTFHMCKKGVFWSRVCGNTHVSTCVAALVSQKTNRVFAQTDAWF